MVIIKMAGGLGNQMFQYALARILQINGRNVLLDCSGYHIHSQKDTIRNYELDKFRTKIRKASPKEISKYYNWWQLILCYLGRIFKKDISKIIIEKEHRYQAKIAKCDNKYLIGFWQSENYFKAARKELLEDFCFQHFTLSQRNQKLQNKLLTEKNSVAVHVRGGDYNTIGNATLYGNICTTDYYKKAFSYIQNVIGKTHYYIFTNDLAWTRQIITEDNNVEVIDWNSEDEGWIDMYLMSICKHNIIANSSFSWWAAWLNQNEKKVVIAPSKWQNGSDIEDIVPSEWVRI